MKKCVVMAGLLVLVSKMNGQQQEARIEEVEIYGKMMNLPYKKVNENVVLITKADIQQSPAMSIDELLQQTVGLDIRRRGSNGVQSDISIRGGSFEQTMTRINGMRMNDSQTGHNSLNIPVDLNSIERIKSIKCHATRRFGNNAYAGVINIITKTSSNNNVKISAQGGDYSTVQMGLSSQFGTEVFSHLFQGNSGQSEGYRHNTDYKINSAFYQNQYQLGNGTLQFQAGFSEKKFGANGFYASPQATEQYEEMQASVVSLMHRQNFGEFSVNSNVYWRRGQDLYLFNREKPEIYRNMHIGNNVGGEINGNYKSALGTTGIGVELRKEFLVSNNLGQRERFLTQLFAEHHFSFINDRLHISPGMSLAHFSNAGDLFCPGMDVGFELNDQHTIFGNIAKVHRIPTFTDLFYVSGTETGNPDLKPENAISYEAGYRFLKNKTQLKTSFFGRETNNGIDWVKNESAEKWQAENIGKMSTKGIEAEDEQRFDGFLSAISAGYTFLDIDLKTQTEFSRYAMDHLKHQFTAKMENRFLKNFSNQLVYRYQERANGYSYHLLDEKLSYHFRNLNVFVLINNLTNTQYTEAFGVPMPGRWFHVGVNYTIKQ